MKYIIFLLVSFMTSQLLAHIYSYHFKKTNLVLKSTHKVTSSQAGGGISFMDGQVVLTAQTLSHMSLKNYLNELSKDDQVKISDIKKINLNSSRGIFFVEEKKGKYHKLKKVFKKNQTLTMIELSCYLRKQEQCAAFAYLLDNLSWK